MHRPEINLFRHPTTTVYIDDSTAFLYSITLGVDHKPCRSFSDPFAGLEYIDRYAHHYDEDVEQSTTTKILPGSRLGENFGQLASNKLQNGTRFAEPSVLVVDYSMPQINGLDLCSRITNPYVKKVLLTGVADEKIAIKALNTELIDFYINKSESTLSIELNRVITHLCDRYFKDIYGWTKDTRLKKAVPYLYNNEFADFFEDVGERLNIVEHYPIENPWGFILVSGEGEAYHLSIASNKANTSDIDGQLSKTTIEPVVIDDGKHCCTVYRYTQPPTGCKIRSFAQFLEGPGLTLPTPPKQRD